MKFLRSNCPTSLGRLWERSRGWGLLFAALWGGSAFAQTSLYYSLPLPSTNWTTFSVPLVENGWAVGATDGPPATAAQMQSVLGNLGALYVEFSGSNVNVSLDNISLAGLATSTFDGCTSDGWGTPIGVSCLVGNPAPCISAGLGSTVQFRAPGKFLGLKSAAYGGTLSLDVMRNDFSPPDFVSSGTLILFSNPDPSQVGFRGVYEWWFNSSATGFVPPSLTNLLQVAAGGFHSLALREDGTVVAWGDNSFGETNVPAGLSNVIAVAGGAVHSLALKQDGTVAAWGLNTYGQTSVPTGLSNVVAVAANNEQSLALKSDGTVVGWGYGYGSGIVDPPAGLSNVVAIACQDFGSSLGTNLALKADGSVAAWAAYLHATNTVHFQTNLPATLTNVAALAAGGSHFLALKTDGTVLGFGDNAEGQTTIPAGLGQPVEIAAGNAFSAALRSDGAVIAWGGDSYVPPGLTNVLTISACGSHIVALVGNGPPITQAAPINPSCNSNGFAVSVPTQCGKVYALEYKNSLADYGWCPLPLVAGTGKLVTLVDAQALAGQRFYRVRRW